MISKEGRKSPTKAQLEITQEWKELPKRKVQGEDQE